MPGWSAPDCQLHIERQAGGNAVGVEFVGLQAFGLDEDLVRILVGEAVDLVFDRRAVARADALRSRRNTSASGPGRRE
jgi:hypothetical protein